MMFGSGIVEVERGALADPKPFVWQTDTAIAKNSWCYTDTLEYKTSRQIICNFIEIISKNGNMLLNVGPKGDGEIPEEDQRILREIGMWMEKKCSLRLWQIKKNIDSIIVSMESRMCFLEVD